MVALLIGVAFVACHSAVVWKYHLANRNIGDLPIPFSCYMFFWGHDLYSSIGDIFFQLMPLIAAIPYTNSYYNDLSSGYAKEIVTRTDKKKYLIAKFTAIFVSGGMVFVIPQILDMMMCSALLPAYPPNPAIGMFAFPRLAFCYSYPLLYLGGFLLIDFIIGGIYATSGLLVTELIENKYLITIFPYVLFLMLEFLCKVINATNFHLPVLAMSNAVEKSGILEYLVSIGGMFTVIFAFYLIREGKKDVF